MAYLSRENLNNFITEVFGSEPMPSISSLGVKEYFIHSDRERTRLEASLRDETEDRILGIYTDCLRATLPRDDRVIKIKIIIESMVSLRDRLDAIRREQEHGCAHEREQERLAAISREQEREQERLVAIRREQEREQERAFQHEQKHEKTREEEYAHKIERAIGGKHRTILSQILQARYLLVSSRSEVAHMFDSRHYNTIDFLKKSLRDTMDIEGPKSILDIYIKSLLCIENAVEEGDNESITTMVILDSDASFTTLRDRLLDIQHACGLESELIREIQSLHKLLSQVEQECESKWLEILFHWQKRERFLKKLYHEREHKREIERQQEFARKYPVRLSCVQESASEVKYRSILSQISSARQIESPSFMVQDSLDNMYKCKCENRRRILHETMRDEGPERILAIYSECLLGVENGDNEAITTMVIIEKDTIFVSLRDRLREIQHARGLESELIREIQRMRT